MLAEENILSSDHYTYILNVKQECECIDTPSYHQKVTTIDS